jgi:hypothetical protein
MRSIQSRVISQVVVLALVLGSALAPAMARTSGANGAAGAAAGPSGGSSPGGGSGAPAINVVTAVVLRAPPRDVLTEQTAKYAGCGYDSTGRLDWSAYGQYCPNVQN